MIYETEDNRFVISSRGRYLPGRYEDRRTARYAFRFEEAILHRLQITVNDRPNESDRFITMAMLKDCRCGD